MTQNYPSLSIKIRKATPEDAAALAKMVVATLEISNAQDYAPDDIQRVVAKFTPDLVRRRIVAGDGTQVAVQPDGTIVGTARVKPPPDGTGVALGTFKVSPDHQGCGVGRALYAHLMTDVPAGTRITVRASIRGEPFYTALGFRVIRDHWHGSERTIEMERER